MWCTRIWTIMYVDLSRPKNPTCGPLIVSRIDQGPRWLNKQIVFVKPQGSVVPKTRKSLYCDAKCEPFTRAWCSWHVRRPLLRNQQCGQKAQKLKGQAEARESVAWVGSGHVRARVRGSREWWTLFLINFLFFSCWSGQSFWVLSLTTHKRSGSPSIGVGLSL